MNKISLNGRLTRDVSILTTQNNKTLGYMTLAVKRIHSKEPLADFIDCQIWGPLAKTISENFTKGDPIIVHGSLNSFTKEIDGKKYTMMRVTVNEFEFNGRTHKYNDAPQPAGGFNSTPEPAEDIPFDALPFESDPSPFC